MSICSVSGCAKPHSSSTSSGCIHNCDEGGICLAELSGYPQSCPLLTNSPVLAQDSGGPALGASHGGKSNAALPASVDADANGGNLVAKRENDAVTGWRDSHPVSNSSAPTSSPEKTDSPTLTPSRRRAPNSRRCRHERQDR